MIQIFWNISPIIKHGITFKEVSVESKKVTKEIISSWEETILPTILTKYQLSDIYNAHEFDLKLCTDQKFDQNFAFREQRYSGGKYSKVWITGMVSSKALAEKIPTFAVGESAIQDGPSSTTENSLVDIVCKRKYGWMEHFLKNGYVNLIVNSKDKGWKFSR